jgi:hypothetical protein
MSKWKKDVELRLKTLEKEVRELNEQVFGLYNR